MNDYDIISEIIGKKMQTVWVEIVEELANASNPSTLGIATDKAISIQTLAGFFSELGAANLTVSFSPISAAPRKETSKNTVIQVAPELQQHMTSGATTLGMSGTITIGATFGF